jgi:hypothetical protein
LTYPVAAKSITWTCAVRANALLSQPGLWINFPSFAERSERERCCSGWLGTRAPSPGPVLFGLIFSDPAQDLKARALRTLFSLVSLGPSGPPLGNVSTVPGTRKRARPNSALTLDDHFRSDYTESVLAIRYLSGEVSVGGGADSFPENGRYTVDGVGARIIYTRKSTPSPVFLQSSIQVLMKKESRHRCRTPN